MRHLALVAAEGDQPDADHGADARGQQHDRRQQLPAEQRAQPGQQLEVAFAHALDAAQLLVAEGQQPQRAVAGERAPGRGLERGAGPAQAGAEQAQADQRQRQVVGQVGGVQVDQRHRHHQRDRRAPQQRLRLRAELPAAGGEQQRRWPAPPADSAWRWRVPQDEQRPFRRSQPSSGRFSCQRSTWPQLGQRERGRDRLSAGRACKRVGNGLRSLAEGRGRRAVAAADALPGLGVAELVLGHVEPPLALQHLRQAVSDDIQKAADAQPEQGQRERREPELRRRHAGAQTTAPSLKIGRYIDTTMPPISTPRMTMMNGSIRLDRPLTISSTSSS